MIVEEEIRLTLYDLCRSCRIPEAEVRTWVIEGVLDPEGETPEEWRFTSLALRRARTALHLSRDLEVNLAGIALALNLLDEITALRSRLGGSPALHDPAADILAE